jgi:hypothetical protein
VHEKGRNRGRKEGLVLEKCYTIIYAEGREAIL